MTTFLDPQQVDALAWDGALEPLGETLRRAPPPPRFAHDLFPLRHTVQDKGKFNVGLTPELKFAQAIDARLLEVGVEKEHTAVYPVIQAYGLGEPNPYWEFQQHSQFPLQGSQKLYLLAAGPADAPLVLRLNLVATVEYRRWGLIPYGPPQSATDRLTFTITGQ